MRKKRQQEELAQQQQQLQLQEPFYVRANVSTFTSTVEIKTSPKDEVSSLSSGDRPNVTILAPISICLGAMLCYIVAGAFTLHKLDGWSFVGTCKRDFSQKIYAVTALSKPHNACMPIMCTMLWP